MTRASERVVPFPTDISLSSCRHHTAMKDYLITNITVFTGGSFILEYYSLLSPEENIYLI